jgi:hypothetical protein
MKTPKEKAVELINKYKFYVDYEDAILDYEQCILNNSKQCALIAVDEIINCDSFFKTFNDTKFFTSFWLKVQDEIINYENE